MKKKNINSLNIFLVFSMCHIIVVNTISVDFKISEVHLD